MSGARAEVERGDARALAARSRAGEPRRATTSARLAAVASARRREPADAARDRLLDAFEAGGLKSTLTCGAGEGGPGGSTPGGSPGRAHGTTPRGG